MANQHSAQNHNAHHRKQQREEERKCIQSRVTCWYRTCGAPDGQQSKDTYKYEPAAETCCRHFVYPQFDVVVMRWCVRKRGMHRRERTHEAKDERTYTHDCIDQNKGVLDIDAQNVNRREELPNGLTARTNRVGSEG